MKNYLFALQFLGFIISLVCLILGQLGLFFFFNGITVIVATILVRIIKAERKQRYKEFWRNRLN